MKKQVNETRKVGIYGTQLLMSIIDACLQEKPDFEVQRIVGAPPNIFDEPDAAHPDVIFFDIAAARDNFAISFILAHPTVTLIGVDLANKKMLLLHGKQSRFLTGEDMVQAVQAGIQSDSTKNMDCR